MDTFWQGAACGLLLFIFYPQQKPVVLFSGSLAKAQPSGQIELFLVVCLVCLIIEKRLMSSITIISASTFF